MVLQNCILEIQQNKLYINNENKVDRKSVRYLLFFLDTIQQFSEPLSTNQMHSSLF